jgi:hypothetical protein
VRITDNSTDKTAGAKNADGKRKRRPNPRYLDDSEDSSGEGQQSDGEQTTSADETTSAASNDLPADNTPPIRRHKKSGRRYTDPSRSNWWLSKVVRPYNLTSGLTTIDLLTFILFEQSSLQP